MFAKKDNFAWITEESYRETISEDFREATICYERGAYKACQVMLGAVMEATLAYALTRVRIAFAKDAGLKELIGIAQRHDLLPAGDSYFGEAIRDYRNLIHPQKQISEKRRPNQESAGLAMKACTYLLTEVQSRIASYAPVSVSASLLMDGKMIPVYKFPFLLGRGEGNDEVFTASSVSSRHARITFERDRFWLTDQKSMNGTFVLENGKARKLKPEKPTALLAGMEFRLGGKEDDPRLTFLLAGEGRTALE